MVLLMCEEAEGFLDLGILPEMYLLFELVPSLLLELFVYDVMDKVVVFPAFLAALKDPTHLVTLKT